MKKLLGLLAATGLVASTSSVVVACGEEQDTTITKDSIIAATAQVKDLDDLEAVNAALAKIEIEGLESLTAVLKGEPTTDVVVTISLVEGYALDEENDTFEIENAIDSKIVSKDMIIAKVEVLEISRDLDEVNEKLGSITHKGLESLTAVLKADSTTDVVVTISLVEDYTLNEGIDTFEVENAIILFVDSEELETTIKDGETEFESFSAARVYFSDLASNFDSVKTILLTEDSEKYTIKITLNDYSEFIDIEDVKNHSFEIALTINSVTIIHADLQSWLITELKGYELTSVEEVEAKLNEILGENSTITSPPEFHLNKVDDFSLSIHPQVPNLVQLELIFADGYVKNTPSPLALQGVFTSSTNK
ncbi:hypothetical protein SCLARK_001630 [Spiroplasma clarkii]|uniref:Lipoprotein n=1 Tax=Spiroplasma clarkii TaxID=2139 RepID=A0A1Y0L254_9MOLU|nr:lipoprotein [Spiroplasma clarkii]ARU92104.1 hypothetical protein SCLARK_001630 [Spiroplasma clarkii]ATX71442.1 hypothetical protein SCLAR_v1c11420 [Spiroplasma clarkii]